MDGLSGAASAFAVASLAGQLVSGFKALYLFWGSIQDAPDDIQAISRELKLLQTVVQDIHNIEKRYGPDRTTIDILESCLTQIYSLTAITEKLERGFRTSTSSRRKWGALKAVLKGNNIKKFQDILRDTKTTLLIVQCSGLRGTINAYHDSHSHQLSHLTTQLTRLQLNSPPFVLETRAAQADLKSHIGAVQSQVSNMISTFPNPALSFGLGYGIGRALEQTSHGLSPHVSEVDSEARNVTTDFLPNLDSQQLCTKDIVIHWSYNVVQSIFGTFGISSEVSQAGRTRHKDSEDLEDDDFIHVTSIRIHPARWLMQLGVDCGIQLAVQNGAQGWKHTLNTFRAVPDDAAIFSACSRGDIDTVRQLLDAGKASVWDVNMNDWTPLHFAADGSHPDLCRFLIREGAYKTTDSCKFFSPLILASRSRTFSHAAQIDTLRLFLNEFDFSEDADRSSNGWDVLYNVIFSGRCHDLTFEWLFRICASEMIRNFNQVEFTAMLYVALSICSINSRVVLSLLSLKDELVIRALKDPIPSNLPVLHASINFSAPHYLGKPPGKGFLYFMSPTSYAMLSSKSFYFWRESLQLAKVNIEDFVKQECKISSVTDEGWEEDTLLRLFRSTLSPVQLPHGLCSRCSDDYGFGWLDIAIEVSWCLELEKIKTRSIEWVESNEIFQKNTGLAIENLEGKGIHCPCVQDHDFVCWPCWVELKDPDHQHESDNDETSSSTTDELSDWEDSPFLPPINILQ